MKTEQKLCPNNHELHLMTSVPFKCAKCTKGFMADRDRWACKECGYMVCEGCVSKCSIKGLISVQHEVIVGH